MLTMYVYVCFILYLTILPVTGTCTCECYGQSLFVQCNPYDSHQVEICLKNNSDATHLDFSRSGLTDIPKEIRFLKRLSTLILSDNIISVLKQGSLDHLVKVTHLDLSGNGLHTIENGTFTDKLQALVELQLPLNNLTELDSSVMVLPQGLRGLHTCSNVSYNQISQVTNSIRATVDIIKINMSMDIIIENNNFTTIDYMLFAKMFNVTAFDQLLPARHCGVNLRMNPFICDCRMYPTSVAIGFLRNMSQDPTDIHVLLIHYFNCNLFRTKISSDARFDVFVSHSSKNEEYVQSTFIPRLESNSPPFRVCSFERHFDVGVQITENITRCISDSVATVLMVSNHFLQSDWCVHEFQESHKKQMRSKDAILIVIVLEELGDNLLDEAFKIYLRTHVYLDVNDTYFWPKLLRSLPLRQERHYTDDDYERTRLL